MDKLEAMHVFTKVVAGGSYAEAARHLGLTRSAVSKAVMELEHMLGVRLFDRTTRHVRPTEAGRAYHERCMAILGEIEEAENQVAGLNETPRGRLRVNAPMTFGTAYLSSAIADFLSTHPQVRVELTLNDRIIDPLEEGFDVTIRIGALADSSLIARRIATSKVFVVAAPEFLARHGTPGDIAEAARLPWLTYGQSAGPSKITFGRKEEAVTIEVDACLCANNGEVLREAACAGLGLTILPDFILGPRMREGRLTPILTDTSPAELPIHALYAPNRYLAAKSRAFIDFLAARYATPGWAAH